MHIKKTQRPLDARASKLGDKAQPLEILTDEIELKTFMVNKWANLQILEATAKSQGEKNAKGLAYGFAWVNCNFDKEWVLGSAIDYFNYQITFLSFHLSCQHQTLGEIGISVQNVDKNTFLRPSPTVLKQANYHPQTIEPLLARFSLSSLSLSLPARVRNTQ